jgi:glucose/mannose transport system substrate-binding protein
VFAAAVAMTACRREDAPREQVSVLSWWWGSAGDKAALGVLEKEYEERTGAKLTPFAGSDEAGGVYQELPQVLAGVGDTPELIQVGSGASLFYWVPQNPSAREQWGGSTRLRPLRELAPGMGALWKGARTAVTLDQIPFAVPVNLHRVNCLVVNTKRARALMSLEKPTLDAFVDAVVNSKTQSLVTDRLDRLVFEGLLPAAAAKLGDDGVYEQIWRGEGDFGPDGNARESLRLALDAVLRMKGNIDLRLRWEDALEAVSSNDESQEVTWVVVGDWAASYLNSLGRYPNPDVAIIPFPGTEDTYIYSVDAFAVPRRAARTQAVADALQVMMDRSVQIEFALAKWALPALQVTRDELPKDASAQSRALVTRWEEFQRIKHFAPATSLLISPHDSLLQNVSVEKLPSLEERADWLLTGTAQDTADTDQARREKVLLSIRNTQWRYAKFWENIETWREVEEEVQP